MTRIIPTFGSCKSPVGCGPSIELWLNFFFRIFLTAAIHFVLALGLEELIIKNESVWKFFRKCQKRRHIGKRYASIEDEIKDFEEWPPKIEKDKKRTETV